MTRRQLKAAIYTRKSTEHGLEQDFNSLEAQREAAEAYIKSQRSEGWVLVDKTYSDGGISGATIERPALQQLLLDIEAGKVDIIVVYKVDRLTRSLSDFALIIKRLDAANASFVSVTQQFNTSNSMGRLTLNVLLSFAQFEREVTAERIRDKIDASKKRGIWMGGVVPLGYDNIDKKLKINEKEAETVRRVFDEYLSVSNVDALAYRVKQLGLRTKHHAGQKPSGRSFSRSALYYILKNPIYIGEIHHKGTCYPGCHQPIINQTTWDKVQQKLAKSRAERKFQTNAKYPSLLTGLIKDEAGDTLSPSHANKDGKRYRYYVSQSKNRGSNVVRYPAEQIELAVKNALINWLTDEKEHEAPFAPNNLSPKMHIETVPSKRLELAKRLEAGTPQGQAAAIKSLVNQVTIAETGLEILINPERLMNRHIDQQVLHPTVGLRVDIVLKKGLKGKKIIVPSQRQNIQRPDKKLILLIARAHLWANDLQSGKFATVKELADHHKADKADVGKQVRLAFLAPDIVQAIMDGRQPPLLNANQLRRLSHLPTDWRVQRQLLGFV